MIEYLRNAANYKTTTVFVRVSPRSVTDTPNTRSQGAFPSFCSSSTVNHSPCHTRNWWPHICDFAARDDTRDLASTKYRRHWHESRRPMPSRTPDTCRDQDSADQCWPIRCQRSGYCLCVCDKTGKIELYWFFCNWLAVIDVKLKKKTGE